MKTEATIENGYVLFWGGCFSNFYPCKIVHNDIEFKSSEQLFMYQKAKYFHDDEIASQILKADTPQEAKKLGRKVKGFNNKEWVHGREYAMRVALIAKFTQNEDLKKELISDKYDGLEFVEASPYDNIWGIGYDAEHAFDVIEDFWGQNLLGKLLNQVRDYIKYGK